MVLFVFLALAAAAVDANINRWADINPNAGETEADHLLSPTAEFSAESFACNQSRGAIASRDCCSAR